MNCTLCEFKSENKKSFSNHLRKHNPNFVGKKGINKAEKNGYWKKESLLTYDGVHQWVARNYPKPKICSVCNQEKKLELAFKDHFSGRKNKAKYTRDFKDWLWLCRKCHMKLDGRLNNLKRGCP